MQMVHNKVEVYKATKCFGVDNVYQQQRGIILAIKYSGTSLYGHLSITDSSLGPERPKSI